MSPNAPCRRPLTALFLLAALCTASVASAQGTVEPAHAQAMADARFKSGLAAYDKGDYEAARLEFLQAQAIFPRPSLLRNLALSEIHTNRPLDALVHLRVYMADAGTTADKRALAERSLGEAYAQTGHLSISAPDGAHVKVDGREVGIAPLKEAVDVVVGLHGVDAAVGAAGLHESVQAGAGKLTEVAFVLPVVGETKVVGAGAVAITPVPTGVVLEPMKPVPYWNGRRTAGVVIAGVGAVGMVVGAVFGAQRGSETSDATKASGEIKPQAGVPAGNLCTTPSASNAGPCASLANAHNSIVSDAHVEDILLVSGGALVAVGLITILWPEPKGPPPAAGFAPLTGPHLAGLSWSTNF